MPAFRRNGILFLLFAGGGVLCTMLISRSMGEVYRARDDRTMALREQASTLQLCHAIASRLPNGRVFVLDRQYRYEFVEGHLGDNCPALEPSAMLGRHIDEIYPVETVSKLKPLIANALNGQESEGEIAYRGRVFRTFGTPLPDDDGRIQRCLLLSQDITQFKADQALLVTMNYELHRQASTDGLLGIANRREFDRRLEQEWQRSLRERQPLSLLLLDVDYFKRYNDAYGHAEGDVCLQQIATSVAGVIQRPADLAARYGGEELAVLLPNTDLEGAQHVAQRIHAHQAELALSFPESPIASHVTVSIGVATAVPLVDDAAAQLVEHADQALYAAKEAGRNCTKAMPSNPEAGLSFLKRLA
ncbi:GGDEF domain-containing protein [Modicisalibacter luteus]